MTKMSVFSNFLENFGENHERVKSLLEFLGNLEFGKGYFY